MHVAMFRKAQTPPFAEGRQRICCYVFGQTDSRIQEDRFDPLFPKKSKDVMADILRHRSEIRGVFILCTVEAVTSSSQKM